MATMPRGCPAIMKRECPQRKTWAVTSRSVLPNPLTPTITNAYTILRSWDPELGQIQANSQGRHLEAGSLIASAIRGTNQPCLLLTKAVTSERAVTHRYRRSTEVYHPTTGPGVAGGRGCCLPSQASCPGDPRGVPAPPPECRLGQPSTCTCIAHLGPHSCWDLRKWQGNPVAPEVSLTCQSFHCISDSERDFGPLYSPPLSAYHPLSLLSLCV